MKNFLIIVLALGVLLAALLTRPGREEFESYLRERDAAQAANPVDAIARGLALRSSADDVEFRDYYLWTVVRKDGKKLYTGLFDHWIDNELVKQNLPS